MPDFLLEYVHINIRDERKRERERQADRQTDRQTTLYVICTCV